MFYVRQWLKFKNKSGHLTRRERSDEEDAR